MQFQGYGASDVGTRRENNEDRFLIDKELLLYAVADGMGGHAAGEVAADLALSTARAELQKSRETIAAVHDGRRPANDLVLLVDAALQSASARVFQEASTQPGRAGMGCTLTLLLAGRNQAVLGHVGDSRLFLLRDGDLTQLSADHTLAAEFMRAGIMTAAQLEGSQYAHVLTRAIGIQSAVQVDTLVIDLLPDDRLLLCSDGVCDALGVHEDLAALLGRPLQAVPGSILEQANTNNARDNVTAVVIEATADSDEEPVIGEALRARFDHLRALPLFTDLSLPSLQRILHRFVEHRAEAGTVLVEAGQEISSLYLLEQGKLVLQDTEGNALDKIEPGHTVGHLRLVRPGSARYSLIAKKPSIVLELSKDRFDKLMRGRPWLGLAIFERLLRILASDLENSLSPGKGVATGHPSP